MRLTKTLCLSLAIVPLSFCSTYTYCKKYGTVTDKVQVGEEPVYENKKVGEKPIYKQVKKPPVIEAPTSVIGIFPFTTASGLDGMGLAVGIESWFVNTPEAKKKYKMVSRTQLASIFKEQEIGGGISKAQGKKLKKAYKLDYILTGHLYEHTNANIDFELQCINVNTTEIVWSNRFSGPPPMSDVVNKAMQKFLPHWEDEVVGYEPVFEKQIVGHTPKYEQKEKKVCLESGTKSTCYIASAAGSSEKVMNTYRTFRSKVLSENSLGKRLIMLYSTYGPDMANSIKQDGELRKRVRKIIKKLTKSLMLAVVQSKELPSEAFDEFADDFISMMNNAAEVAAKTGSSKEYTLAVVEWFESNPNAYPFIVKAMTQLESNTEFCEAINNNVKMLNNLFGYTSNSNVVECSQ